MNYHQTVLKQEIVDNFIKKENGIYLDVTCGGGGHSEALLSEFPKIFLIANDWDANAVKETTKRLEPFNDRTHIMQSSFSQISSNLKKAGYEKVDGILADFGTSRHQLSHQNGFSFHHDSFLDMRMSNAYTKIIAADLLAHYSEKELADLFYYYGQERHAKKVAREIVQERKVKAIRTTMHLASVVARVIPKNGKFNPATKIFQALRIEVNKELQQIESLLNQSSELLNPEGTLACISFHSLEDGLVKKFYMDHKKEFTIVGPDKIILPSQSEIKENPASRSAKLRIIQKNNLRIKL